MVRFWDTPGVFLDTFPSLLDTSEPFLDKLRSFMDKQSAFSDKWPDTYLDKLVFSFNQTFVQIQKSHSHQAFKLLNKRLIEFS
jgi:hypothetical protein